ncbi:MAG: hypothetical protein ABH986_02475 [archaeon]
MVLEDLSNTAAETASSFIGDPSVLVIGIVLIIAAVILFMVIKKVLVNSIAGLIVLGIVKFVFGINLPFIPALIITAIFGLGGIGAMLVLRFLGVL